MTTGKFGQDVTTTSKLAVRKVAVLGCDGWIGGLFKHYVSCTSLSSKIEIFNLSRSSLKVFNLSSDKFREYLEYNNISAIINFAGGSYTGLHNHICKNPQKAWISDFELPRFLVKSVQDTGVELIHLSTGDVYDYSQIESMSNNSFIFSEGDLCNAVFQSDSRASFFSGMKFNAEQIIRMHPWHYIFRIKNPIDYFPNDNNFICKMMASSVLPNTNDSFTFLPDVFKAMILALLPDEEFSYGIYHIAIPDLHSYDTLSKAIFKQLEIANNGMWDFKLCAVNEYISYLNSNVSFSCLNTNKIQRHLGSMTPFEYIKDKVIPSVVSKMAIKIWRPTK